MPVCAETQHTARPAAGQPLAWFGSHLPVSLSVSFPLCVSETHFSRSSHREHPHEVWDCILPGGVNYSCPRLGSTWERPGWVGNILRKFSAFIPAACPLHPPTPALRSRLLLESCSPSSEMPLQNFFAPRNRACVPSQFSSVTQSYPIPCDRMDCSTPDSSYLLLCPRVYSNSCSLSQWLYLTISSSAAPFFFSFQSFPASMSFPLNWLFASGGQSIGATASASVLPMNIQVWFPLGLTGLMILPSKGLSRLLSSATVWKQQFFGTQPSLWSSSHIHTWLLEKP